MVISVHAIWAAAWQKNKVAYAPSQESDQPGHPPSLISDPPSLISVFVGAQQVAKDPSFLHSDSEDSDQTGQMTRLIWVFAGHIGYFLGFFVQHLKFKQ